MDIVSQTKTSNKITTSFDKIVEPQKQEYLYTKPLIDFPVHNEETLEQKEYDSLLSNYQLW